MIHWSALHGTPYLAAIGTALCEELRLGNGNDGRPSCALERDREGSMLDIAWSQLARSILSTASRLISDDSSRRRVIGGYTLDGQKISIFAKDAETLMVGIMAVWAAGGTAMPMDLDHPADLDGLLGLAPHPVLLDTNTIDKVKALGKDWSEGGWITEMDIVQIDTGQETSGAEVDMSYAEWLRDLKLDDESGTALVRPRLDSSSGTISHAELEQTVMGHIKGTPTLEGLLRALWHVCSPVSNDTT